MRIALLSLMVFASCGLETTEAASVGTSRQAVVDLSQPASLTTWDWTQPLVPRGARSAYLVAVQDPNSAKHFLAWGYDAKSGAAFFFVRGETGSHVDRFLAEFSRDAATAMAFDPGFSWGSGIQISKKPDPPAPIGDWRTWSRFALNKAVDLHTAANTFGH